MKLYYYPATCAQAVHIMLREAGVEPELLRVEMRTKVLPDGSDYAAVNPKVVVPALIDDAGKLHTEVIAILHDLPAILGKDTGSRPSHQLEWLSFLATEVHRSFTPLYRPGTPDAWATITRANIRRAFDYLERHLTGREFLLDTGFGPADAYLFVILGWAGEKGIPLDTMPALNAFHDRIAARPAVRQARRAEGME